MRHSRGAAADADACLRYLVVSGRNAWRLRKTTEGEILLDLEAHAALIHPQNYQACIAEDDELGVDPPFGFGQLPAQALQRALVPKQQAQDAQPSRIGQRPMDFDQTC